MRLSVASRFISLLLAFCLFSTSGLGAEYSAATSASASVSSGKTGQADPLLDPARVPENIVIEYGSRFYWRDPATGKVFWAQKTLLEAIFRATKPQPPHATEPQPQEESAAPPFPPRSAPVCRADLGGLNAGELMKSAAQIESRVGVCGGARIAGDLVITNGHCVIGPSGGWREAQSARGRESGVTARFVVNGQAHSVRCGKVLAISPFQTARGGRDFAVLRCSGIPANAPIMRVTEQEPLVRESVALATWDWQRRGVPSRVSIGRVLQNDNSYLAARLKIIDGNSGSMIVNERQEICGVANGAGFGPAAGAAFFHSMKEILRQVRQQSPETYAEIDEATHAAAPRCLASASRDDAERETVPR